MINQTRARCDAVIDAAAINNNDLVTFTPPMLQQRQISLEGRGLIKDRDNDAESIHRQSVPSGSSTVNSKNF
jgi:hypothetical protein